MDKSEEIKILILLGMLISALLSAGIIFLIQKNRHIKVLSEKLLTKELEKKELEKVGVAITVQESERTEIVSAGKL